MVGMRVVNGTPQWDPRAGVLPPPDLLQQASDLGATAYAASTVMHATRALWYRITVNANVFLHIGTAAPSDSTEVELLRNTAPLMGYLPAGQMLWLARQGTADVRGSVVGWFND